MKTFYVYIMTNKSHSVLYTGVTNNLSNRIAEHAGKYTDKSFTSKYNVNKLVYFEEIEDAPSAIEREKQIKAGSRASKIKLIELTNKEWKDLSEGMY